MVARERAFIPCLQARRYDERVGVPFAAPHQIVPAAVTEGLTAVESGQTCGNVDVFQLADLVKGALTDGGDGIGQVYLGDIVLLTEQAVGDGCDGIARLVALAGDRFGDVDNADHR